MSNFQQIYSTLGITPGDSWEDVRNAYKKLVRTWHPDRFGEDESARHYAEERTKAINQAYQALDDYFHQHGRLPLEADSTPVLSNLPPVRSSVTTGQPEGRNTPWPPYRSKPYAAGNTRRERSPIYYIAVTVAGILALIVIGFFLDSDAQRDETAPSMAYPSPGDAMIAPTKAAAVAGEQAKPASPQTFGRGASLGEVFSIQGAPDRADQNIWYYGDAQVIFENGRVVRWVDTTPPRLKASEHTTSPDTENRHATHIEVGSTKADVRAIQGTPIRESDTVWDYGLSRIYFDHEGRVSRWSESPLAPLKTRR